MAAEQYLSEEAADQPQGAETSVDVWCYSRTACARAITQGIAPFQKDFVDDGMHYSCRPLSSAEITAATVLHFAIQHCNGGF
jgi:hypothetical protein